ncbi:hypothetical protein JZ751_005702 [Albula glossodonta]|uniref:Uncharacterized protein n=1 Tax=Albula glossodonta TaxID=121402 RepID=A0A8T2MP11_9TELE|nr:hypothetical protein JZ751_005702 [Albula glossodonta]
MEDREALKRQIELLQNLINNHKSVHGDAPSRTCEWHPRSSAPARGRGLRSSPSSFAGQTRPYAQAPAGLWRKKYSLSNKSTALSSANTCSGSSAASLQQLPQASWAATATGSLSGHSQASADCRPSVSHGPMTLTKPSSAPRASEAGAVDREGAGASPSPSSVPVVPPGRAGQKGGAEIAPGESSRPPCILKMQQHQAGAAGDRQAEGSACLAGGNPPEGKSLETEPPVGTAAPQAGSLHSPRTKALSSALLQLKPRLQRLDPVPKPVAAPVTPSSPPPPLPPPPFPAKSPRVSGPLARTVLTPGSRPRLPPSRAKSQFTWVKSSEGSKVPSPNPSLSPAPSPVGASIRMPPPPNPGRKTPHRHAVIAKATKYTWVSSSSSSSLSTAAEGSGTRPRLPRKPLSPKALDTAQRATAGAADRRAKLVGGPHSAKTKKGSDPNTPPAHSSRYRWKAAGQNLPAASRGGSVYRWTSEKENGPKGVRGPGPPLPHPTAAVPAAPVPPSPTTLKLRSKISRRRSSSRWDRTALNDVFRGLLCCSCIHRPRQHSANGPIAPLAAGDSNCVDSHTVSPSSSPCSGAVSGPERRSSPVGVLTVKSRYALRRRTSGSGLGSSSGSGSSGRRAQARGLVSFGRHKLRRLSPSTTSTSTTLSGTGRHTAPATVCRRRCVAQPGSELVSLVVK